MHTSTGTASHAGRKRYGIRQIATGTMLDLKRPFGSITAADKWLEAAGRNTARYDIVDLDA